MCFWRIQDPTLQEKQTVTFVVVFKAPKNVDKVELKGLVAAEPKFTWLSAQLGDVMGELNDKVIALFQKSEADREGDERLAVADREEWTLSLP